MNRSDDATAVPRPIEPVESNGPAPSIQLSESVDPAPSAEGAPSADPVAAEAAAAKPVGDVINVVRGFCMGAADTVPGVSGGTVALILGHYERLITAISHIDSVLAGHLIKREFRQAAAYVDFRFLAALAVGLLTGVVTLAGLMHWLLDHRMSQTLAVFFGLVVASAWVVAQYVQRWRGSRFAACLSGAVVALAITMVPAGEGSMSLTFLFLASSIAICAMILPGISGAFVLLLLGVYHPVMGLIKGAAKGDFTAESLMQIGVFGLGCAFGLLAFSRLLHWLLRHHHDVTMAGLLGLMIGSLAKVWPLQMATQQTAGLEMKLRQFVYVAPADWPGNITVLVVLAVAAAAAVIFVERLSQADANR